MPKRPLALAAAIPIDTHTPTLGISYWFSHLPPALKRFPAAVWTLVWPFCFFSLDFRQFQDNNRHDELLVVAISAITILQEVRHFFKTNHLCYRYSAAQILEPN
jgi:hypothetical protein